MKNLKTFENIFQGGAHKDEEGIEKHIGKKPAIEEKLKNAFIRCLVKSAGIKIADITDVYEYNKYIVITRKDEEPVRIDFTIKQATGFNG